MIFVLSTNFEKPFLGFTKGSEGLSFLFKKLAQETTKIIAFPLSD
jgi:hypothetical protein